MQFISWQFDYPKVRPKVALAGCSEECVRAADDAPKRLKRCLIEELSVKFTVKRYQTLKFKGLPAG